MENTRNKKGKLYLPTDQMTDTFIVNYIGKRIKYI